MTFMQKKLRELTEDNRPIKITVLVVGKNNPNYFANKADGDYRGVLTLTVRDSETHLLNCKFWGSKATVQQLMEDINIGDVINIVNMRINRTSAPNAVNSKAITSSEMYSPQTPMRMYLSVNEGEGSISHHDYLKNRNLHDALRELTNISHKPLHSTLRLSDVNRIILDKTQEYRFVDLLVAIVSVRPIRELRNSNTNEPILLLEVVVLDQSNTEGTILTIWNKAWLQRGSQHWVPFKTVLHLIDIKATFSEYYKCATLATTGRTLIYENPPGAETQQLATFAASVPVGQIEYMIRMNANTLPKPEDIVNIMSVMQIYERVNGSLADNSANFFTAICNGMLTKLDLDGFDALVSRRCKFCHRFLRDNQQSCESEDCLLRIASEHPEHTYDYFFNVNLNLTDHTGCLKEIRLSDDVAEQFLNTTIEEFLKMSSEEKSNLKWCHLLNYVEAKLLVKKPVGMRKHLSIIVAAIRHISLAEMNKSMVPF